MNEKEQAELKNRGYISGALHGAAVMIIGMTIGNSLKEKTELYKPEFQEYKTIYANNDSITDLLHIQSNHIYLQNKKGKYYSLESITKNKLKKVELSNQKLIDSINNSYNSIQKVGESK